jgi:hypothetical protein
MSNVLVRMQVDDASRQSTCQPRCDICHSGAPHFWAIVGTAAIAAEVAVPKQDQQPVALPKAPTDELSLEDTNTLHARVGSSPDAIGRALYDRDVGEPHDKTTSTGELRVLSGWISAHREIAELNGVSGWARPKQKK